MPSCDMCGKETGLVNAVVEKVEMKVCQSCARFGTIQSSGKAPAFSKKAVMHKEPALRVSSQYAALLRQAREKQGLSQEDFAKSLQERESVVAKWEQGKMPPSVEVARKLEKMLGIRLVEEEVEQSFVKEKSRVEGFTLGDFMKVRKK